MNTKKEVVVLDIGTTKICCAIAKSSQKWVDPEKLDLENEIRVIGVGHQLAKGIRRGAISNLEELEDSILNAITTSEKEAQKQVRSVFIAIPPWAVESHAIENSIDIGLVPVDEVHISSLIDFDTKQYIDPSREVVQTLPISFSIDSTDGIQDPIGMVGNKLSCVIHSISAPKSFIDNIKNCLLINNIKVEGFVVSSYASGISVLLEDEIMSGVTLIDIGGVSTSIACFYDGTLLYLGYVPMGSQNITNDITLLLSTTRSHAERLKILYGANAGASSNEEQILVPKIDEYGEEHIQNISKNMLDTIIKARLEEILEHVQNHLYSCGADKSIYQRIVITGGGSRISGLNEFIKSKRYFGNSSVRLGKPIATIGSHDFVQTASFATTAGLATYCLCDFFNNPAMKLSGSRKSFWQRIVTWFKRGV